MSKKNSEFNSKPLPYCYISKPMRNYNLNFDNCFSPQAKIQSPIFSPQINPIRTQTKNQNPMFSPRNPTRTQTPMFSPRNPTRTFNPVVTGGNVSYPYYMPEEWFTEAPPMGIQVEEQQEQEQEENNKNEIGKLSNLYIPELSLPENMIGELPARNKGTKSRGIGHHHGAVEELTHRLERFKIKTLHIGGGGGGGVVKK